MVRLGLGPEKDYAGEDQQHIFKRQTRSLVREGASEKQDHNCQRVKYLVMNPRWGSTPRLTD
jgi:hypothetical protein